MCLGSLMTRGTDRAGAGSKKESLSWPLGRAG